MTKRKYFIDQDALAKLEALGDKVLKLINNYRQRVMSSAAASADSRSFKHQLKKYISGQRDQRLYVGTVRALDHKLNEPREFRVYLSASTQAGGYFDDYMDVYFLEYIKHLADERGVEAAARKHRLRKSIVQYAQETRVKDLRPLRGRGDIVLSVDAVLRNQSRPYVMDILTHELTHGIQMLVPRTTDYDRVVEKIHNGEDLTREERHIYHQERGEFEAHLNGMFGRMHAKYQALNDPDRAFEELSKHTDPENISNHDIEDHIASEKQRYRSSYETNLFALSRQIAQEYDINADAIERKFIELNNNIKQLGAQLDLKDQQLDDIIAQAHETSARAQQGDQQARKQHKELKTAYDRVSKERDDVFANYEKQNKEHADMYAKYIVFVTGGNDFIASISNSNALWEEFKQAIREFIDSLD